MTQRDVPFSKTTLSRHMGSLSAFRAVVSVHTVCDIIWGFTESDFFTFALPNTLFGVMGAFTSPRLIDGPQISLGEIMHRLPTVLLFNFYSLLIFDLSNQRSPESVEEDRVNKPWRPIPSGKITRDQTRKVILFTAPTALGLNYALGVWKEGLLVQALNWYYNDLKGGDEVFRDAIIAISYGVANKTSLKLAIGSNNMINSDGNTWIIMISCVILTTMHIQDLKDQDGDISRGRKTVPLVMGDRASRVVIALLVPLWTQVCTFFWRVWGGWYCWLCALSILIGWRALYRRGRSDDRHTWKLWCLWHASLYVLPLVNNWSGEECV